MTTLDPGSLPYPGMSITEALRQLDRDEAEWGDDEAEPADTATMPRFIPAQQAAPALNRKAGNGGKPRAVPAIALEADDRMEVLGRAFLALGGDPAVLEGYSRTAPAERLPLHDATAAALTLPALPGEHPADGVGGVKMLLAYACWQAASWYEPEPGCPDCNRSMTGMCGYHAEQDERAQLFQALYNTVIRCASDDQAVSAVKASGAEPGDLAGYGSPLAAMLEGSTP